MNASLTRRLLALSYDLFFIVAILILGTLALLPFHHGMAFNSHFIYYKIYLFALIMLYFIFFWHTPGQTPGMAVWKIRLISSSSEPHFFRLCARFLLGLVSILFLGGGLWCVIFFRDRRTFYDRLTGFKVISTKTN